MARLFAACTQQKWWIKVAPTPQVGDCLVTAGECWLDGMWGGPPEVGEKVVVVEVNAKNKEFRFLWATGPRFGKGFWFRAHNWKEWLSRT